jgi:hypothetical protein
MRLLFFTALLLCMANSFAAEDNTAWENTTLSDALIQKIQTAQYEYRKCVSEEMPKPEYQTLESKDATGKIIKKCEPTLAKMRETYIAEKVPPQIADRHLKKMRLQTLRNTLQNMMFAEAARKSGQIK